MATRGVYKSIDELQTVGVIRPATGFDTWPTDAIGRQVAVGRSTGKEARILFCLERTSPAEKHFAWRTNALAWSEHIVSGGEDHYRCRPLTPSAWLVFVQGTDSDFAGTDCWRTKDAGATWVLLAAPQADHVWQDIRAAADGRWWGVTIDSTDENKSQIWYSDNDGDSWITSHSRDVVNEKRHMVLTHPTDFRRIAVIAENVTGGLNDNMYTFMTNDRGATWSLQTATDVKFTALGSAAQFGVAMLLSGRMVAVLLGRSPGNPKIVVSDDDGATWPIKKDFGTGISSSRALGPAVALPGGALIYVLYNKFDVSPAIVEIWESRDGGSSWAKLVDVPHPDDPGQDFNGGLAIDTRVNALYIGGNPGNGIGVLRLSPISANGIWTDLTGNIIPVPLRLIDRTNNIAVIP